MRIVWTAFVLSEIAMFGIAFVWPWLDDDPSNPLLRIAALGTLILFLASLGALLGARVRSARTG